MIRIKNILWILPLAIFILLMIFIPLLILFSDAFSSGISNFTDVWNDDNFTIALKNTLIMIFVVPTISILVSLIITYFIYNLTSHFFQKAFQTLYYLPMLFIGMAFSISFIYLFASDYGLINQIIIWFGGETIDWLGGSQFNSIWTIVFCSILNSIPMQVLVFSLFFISSTKNYEKLRTSISISKFDFYWRVVIKDNFQVVNYLFFIEFVSCLQAMPVAYYNNDLQAMFVAETQTLAAYISRMVELGKTEYAAVASLMTCILGILIISSYYVIKKVVFKIWIPKLQKRAYQNQ